MDQFGQRLLLVLLIHSLTITTAISFISSLLQQPNRPTLLTAAIDYTPSCPRSWRRLSAAIQAHLSISDSLTNDEQRHAVRKINLFVTRERL